MNPNDNITMRSLNRMDNQTKLKSIYYQFVEGLQEGLKDTLTQGQLAQIDLVVEWNTIFLKEIKMADQVKPLLKPDQRYFADAEGSQDKQSLLYMLQVTLQQSKERFQDLKPYESKAIRTLRDTIYRLQKEGAMDTTFDKDGSEILYTHEHRVKILLEKRMAHHRITLKRYSLFGLPVSELEPLLATHPRDFDSAIEQKLRTLPLETPPPNDFSLFTPPVPSSAPSPAVTTEVVAPATSEGSLQFSVAPHTYTLHYPATSLPLQSASEREELLKQLCTQALNIPLTTETLLIIQLLAMK